MKVDDLTIPMNQTDFILMKLNLGGKFISTSKDIWLARYAYAWMNSKLSFIYV